MARLVLDVDTGTDDAGALVLAATHPSLSLAAAIATFGNCSRDQAARNTLAVLEAARCPAPVHLGAAGASGPAPFSAPATVVMGSDGLGDAGVADPAGQADAEPAAEALCRLAAAHPGELTLVALAPLASVAAALQLDPGLPGKLAGLVVMGGALRIGGNVTAAAEANVAHDPEAAAAVVAAFGAPGALAGGQPPRLVPLDVTLRSPLTDPELEAVGASPHPGTALLHQIWSEIWPTGLLETGSRAGWPAHDLLATWCVVDPSVCTWHTLPLAVDTGRSAAWGATVADFRLPRLAAWAAARGLELADMEAARRIAPSRWAVATDVDAGRYRAGLRRWLAGGT